MTHPSSGSERELTADQEAALFHQARRSIIRIEQQQRYVDETWARHLRRWLDDDPIDPLSEPEIVSWLLLIAELTQRGVSVTRVRILDDPPTDDQRWMQWLGRWNTAAGEEMRYISRPDAEACGLVPGVGSDDWWLFDETTLLTLRFDTEGIFQSAIATTDSATVQGALDWWPTALTNSMALPSDIELPHKDQLTRLG